MKPQEAIQFLKETIAGCHILRDRQLKAVCEVSIKALEKQIPKKPILDTIFPSGIKWWLCPTCNHNNIGTNDCYCHQCGQALDWSDSE